MPNERKQIAEGIRKEAWAIWDPLSAEARRAARALLDRADEVEHGKEKAAKRPMYGGVENL